MIDPMFAAHMSQMRNHAERRRRAPVEPAPISRRRLIALATTAVAAVLVGLSAYRPATPSIPAQRSPSL